MNAKLRIGVLRLADSAPAVVASARGLFAAEGLDVAISTEPSWANVADKLTYGLLEAAVMLPPLALAAVAGVGRPAARIVVPMGLTQGGNTVVLGHAAAAAVMQPGLDTAAAGRRLVAWMRAQPERQGFAVVHDFSGHNLLLRDWLAAAGGDPDRDMRTAVVPPERVVRELAAGRIAGFCAGAPWGEVAEAEGAGRVLLGTSAIRPRHPEKCLAVAAPWAEREPAALGALMRGLRAANHLCADPAEAADIARLLAATLDLPEAPTRATLSGGAGRETVGFQADPARLEDAAWFLGEMARWGWFSGDANGLAATVYRPDLLDMALL